MDPGRVQVQEPGRCQVTVGLAVSGQYCEGLLTLELKQEAAGSSLVARRGLPVAGAPASESGSAPCERGPGGSAPC